MNANDKVWDTLKITTPVLIKNQQTPQKEFAAIGTCLVLLQLK